MLWTSPYLNRDAVLSFSRNQYVLFLLGGTESLYEISVAHAMVLSHILIELIGRHDAGHRAACSTAIAPVEIRRLDYASPSPTASAPYIVALVNTFHLTHVVRVLVTEDFRTF